jgi:thiol-disulfide isomerase/thioredoxin
MKFLLPSVIFFSLTLLSCQPKKSETTAADLPAVVQQPIVVNDLPNLNVIDVSGSPMSLHELPGEAAIIFCNPDCDHCQNEARDIMTKKNLLKNQQLYFVSAEPMQAIIKFINDYNMKESNFHFSHVEAGDVYQNLGSFNAIPAIFLFKDKKKIGKFEGTTPVEDIANVFTVK